MKFSKKNSKLTIKTLFVYQGQSALQNHLLSVDPTSVLATTSNMTFPVKN